jgi:hypothetical protein
MPEMPRRIAGRAVDIDQLLYWNTDPLAIRLVHC